MGKSHDKDDVSRHDRWARLRFSVVGPLLAAPPVRGELHEAITKLAEKMWRHPTTGEPVSFGASTIERWFYAARNERRDPVKVLRRRVRKDAGRQPSLGQTLRDVLRRQWQEHRGWSYQLHAENLAAAADLEPVLGVAPSVSTVRRYLKAHGFFPVRRRVRRDTPGAERAHERLERLEVRSFEADYVHGLWHLDFHAGSRKVLTPEGEWATPHLLGVLDDRSRLVCHGQWYLEETAEALIHGLSQAIQKRGLPRALMHDNGAAMVAEETQQGLHDLSIFPDPTLPYSPYQNGKQESFWGNVEGRFLPMLEGVKELTLALLNESFQPWVELDYNQRPHSEIGTTPLRRFLEGPTVGRESPSTDELRRVFRLRATRTQRRSDGTVSIEGRRFEVPSRYRTLERVVVRYARFDLSVVDMVDERTDKVLAPLHPLDRSANADGRRRSLEPVPDAAAASEPAPRASGIAPLLRKLIADYQATGLPAAYLPHRSQRPRRSATKKEARS